MKFISVDQFKNNLDYYLSIAESEEIMVTRNNETIFTIIPTLLAKKELYK